MNFSTRGCIHNLDCFERRLHAGVARDGGVSIEEMNVFQGQSDNLSYPCPTNASIIIAAWRPMVETHTDTAHDLRTQVMWVSVETQRHIFMDGDT
jgi:hypothetical protein